MRPHNFVTATTAIGVAVEAVTAIIMIIGILGIIEEGAIVIVEEDGMIEAGEMAEIAVVEAGTWMVRQTTGSPICLGEAASSWSASPWCWHAHKAVERTPILGPNPPHQNHKTIPLATPRLAKKCWRDERRNKKRRMRKQQLRLS